MKKAFTLVELLAVIVILAIILAIAIPGISSIIDNVKLQSYINNEDMMVKATKTYIGINDSYLPANIGNTKEVKLSDLQSNNYIGTITDPNDKNVTCDGYVLITKVDANNYDYTPYLKCGYGVIANGYINDGLIYSLKLDNNAYDYTPYGRHGIVSGAIPVVNRFNELNSALSFDGVDDYVELPDSSALRLATGGTILAWVYTKSYGEGPYGRIIDKGTDASATNGYMFYVDGGAFTFWVNGAGSATIANGGVKLNTWQFAAVTFNASGRKIYVNGVDSTTSGNALTGLPPDVAGNVRIGQRAGNTDRTFDGYIDDMKIYNRVLSANEIKHMYDIEKNVSR